MRIEAEGIESYLKSMAGEHGQIRREEGCLIAAVPDFRNLAEQEIKKVADPEFVITPVDYIDTFKGVLRDDGFYNLEVWKKGVWRKA